VRGRGGLKERGVVGNGLRNLQKGRTELQMVNIIN